MDNDIFCSTISGKKFASFHNIIQDNKKSRWGIILAAFLSNLILPGLMLSYGVILAIKIDNGLSASWGLITPCLFCTMWTIFDPWTREIADSCGRKVSNRTVAFVGIILAFLAQTLGCIPTPFAVNTVLFGVLGGIGTSIVLSQIDFVITDTFESNLNEIRAMCKCAQALGQSIVPLIIIFIYDLYGRHMSFLLLSSFVLQILPFIIYFKTETISQHNVTPKFKKLNTSYSVFNNESMLSSSSNNDIPMMEISQKSWKSPSDENLSQQYDELEDIDIEKNSALQTAKDVSEDKTKIFIGVEILPQILEESERSDTDSDESDSTDMYLKKKEISHDINRMSVISDNLDEIITKSNNDNILNNAGPERDWTDNSYKNDTRSWISKMKCDCSTYGCYRAKRRVKNVLAYINDTFFLPLLISIKTWQFYPTVMMKLSLQCMTFSVPSFFAVKQKSDKSIDFVKETALLTSVHGFSSLCLLILLLRLSTMQKSRFKYVSISGILLSSLGLFVVMESTMFQWILLGSALSGIGYGALISTCEETIRNYIGLRKWTKLRGSVDTITGLLTIVIGTLIIFIFMPMSNGIKYSFGFLICLLFISGITWMLLTLMATIKKYKEIKNVWPQM